MCTTLGTIVFYGFQQYPASRDFWLAISAVMVTLSTMFPFMGWFNDVKYRVSANSSDCLSLNNLIASIFKNWRIFFFLCIAFTSIAPMMHLSYLCGTANTFAFMRKLHLLLL